MVAPRQFGSYVGAATQPRQPTLASLLVFFDHYSTQAHRLSAPRPHRHINILRVYRERPRSPDLVRIERKRDPWTLVTSLGLVHLTAKQIVKIYSKRMQIEESFRDLKCARYGCAFDYSLTRHPDRLMILVLIHALATFVAWLMAMSLTAEADTTLGGITSNRPRRHYSLLRLGWETLRRYHHAIYSQC